jgi:hypothetical protein
MTPDPDPARPHSMGPACGSLAPSATTSLPGLIPWVPGLRRQTPAAATVLAPGTDPGTDPVTQGTGSRTSHTSLCSPGAAPARSPAGGPWAASLAQLTEGTTTEVTAEAAAAVPAEEARSEAVRGRGGNSHHHPSRIYFQYSVYGLIHSRFFNLVLKVCFFFHLMCNRLSSCKYFW